MAATTTIVIRQETKERLEELKRHPRESYNDVVDRLARMATDDEPLARDTLKSIEEAVEGLRRGRFYAEEEIEAELELG